MDRFQRFQSGSRTAEPGRPDTGSQPIGLEPEPVPVMADIRKPIGSKTGTPAEGGNDMSQPWRPDWLDAVCRKIDAKIAAEQRARRRRRYSLDEIEATVRRWRRLGRPASKKVNAPMKSIVDSVESTE